jgi:predicted dehydrogenase
MALDMVTRSRRKIYSAVVIGAGKISSEYDEKGDKRVLTHMHALSLQKDIICLGIHDTSQTALKEAGRKWGVPTFKSFSEMMNLSPDLVIIAVPDEFHEEYLRSVADYSPKLVICEKPLTLDYSSSILIRDIYKKLDITLVVNFQRRFDSEVLNLKRKIDSGELGKPLGGVLWYSKGIIHNGSHAIDLFLFLFGSIRECGVYEKVIDYLETDPTVRARLKFKDVSIELIPGDERLFSLFEVDLIFEKGRYRFIHSGLEYEFSEVKPDPVFNGYYELMSHKVRDTGLNNAMTVLYTQVLAFFNHDEMLVNEVNTTLETQKIVEYMAKAKHGEIRFFTPPTKVDL